MELVVDIDGRPTTFAVSHTASLPSCEQNVLTLAERIEIDTSFADYA